MSLITRCPACGTMFKVVPDQLRISEGWVRCGHCSEIFDARAYLQSANPLPGPSTPLEHDDFRAPISASTEAGRMHEASLPSGIQDPLNASHNEAPLAASALIARRAESESDELVSSGAMLVNSDATPLLRQGGVQEDPLVFQSSAQPLRTPVTQARAVSDAVDSVLDDDVSFVREARRKAFWHQPLVRIVLGGLSLLLACGLLLQLAVHERNRLVAMEPQLKPWLVRLCASLDCNVGVPRQIESVVIDSSTFSKVRGDVFRLSFTVRNTAGLEVATPAVELTLTDTQDQAVVRRILLPAEFGAKSSLAPKDEWNAALDMSVDPNGGASRVAGYRLLAFYP